MEEDPIGEIDIIEGTNFQEDDIVSLHTGSPCYFYSGEQTGQNQRPNCTLFDIKQNLTNK